MIRAYPELRPQVQEIVSELGEVIDEYPFSRYREYFTCRVNLVKPLKVIDLRSDLHSKALFCNESTAYVSDSPNWLEIYIYSTERMNRSYSPFGLPQDGAKSIFLSIRLEQDSGFWNHDRIRFEAEATEETLLKEIRIFVENLRNYGIKYSFD